MFWWFYVLGIRFGICFDWLGFMVRLSLDILNVIR